MFTYGEALAIARAAVEDPQARLEPRAAEDRTTPVGRRVSFARAVRNELDRRKRRLGILSYDDLLVPAARRAGRPRRRRRAQRMRQRWRIVLVDEFQDTDPVQWEVLDRAFSGHATMVLIGDPKQAIYAFRGGDVVTYLAAAETATTQADARGQLAQRRRAGRRASRRCCGGAALGDPRIVVRPVAGAPRRQPAGRCAAAGAAPGAGACGARTSASGPGTLTVERGAAADRRGPRARRTAAARVAARRSTARELAAARRRGDLATRTPTWPTARQALPAAACPAVIAGGGSVFATPAAVEWLTLLEAMEQPHRSVRVRAAALTCFFGRTAAELDAGGDDLTDEVAEPLRDWVELFADPRHGGGARGGRVDGLPARVLAEVGGDRRLTDLRHIGEALHEVRARPSGSGCVALLTWLREQVAEAEDGRGQRAHPPARLRRRRGPARHHPRQQGAGVPRRLPARARRPATCATPDAAALPRRRRAGVASTSAAAAPTGPSTAGRWPTRRPASGCGCSTSRSPAPSRRSSAGGRRPRTPSPRRCTGC